MSIRLLDETHFLGDEWKDSGDESMIWMCNLKTLERVIHVAIV